MALTRQAWLAQTGGAELGPVPDTFDLWVYGYDFDADREGAEHCVRIMGPDGKPAYELPLPPKGQACNGKTGCVIYTGLTRPSATSKALSLEIVNLPENWTSSTLLAFYVMPSGLEVSPARAATLIRQQPDWPRKCSIGFVELGWRGLNSTDLQPVTVSIELVGPPKEPARLPN